MFSCLADYAFIILQADPPKEAQDAGSGPLDTGSKPSEEADYDLFGGLSSPPKPTTSHANSAHASTSHGPLEGITSMTSFEEQSLVEDDAAPKPSQPAAYAPLLAGALGPVQPSPVQPLPIRIS